MATSTAKNSGLWFEKDGGRNQNRMNVDLDIDDDNGTPRSDDGGLQVLSSSFGALCSNRMLFPQLNHHNNNNNNNNNNNSDTGSSSDTGSFTLGMNGTGSVESLKALSSSIGSYGLKWFPVSFTENNIMDSSYHNRHNNNNINNNHSNNYTTTTTTNNNNNNHSPPSFVRCLVGKESSSRLRDLATACQSQQVRGSILRFLNSRCDEDMVAEIEQGFTSGHPPTLAKDCCGGTYFMRDRYGQTYAVFKPADEEPYAPENPKGYVGTQMYGTSPMKEGVDVGMAAERECAAFMLDHDNQANVPETFMLRVRIAQLRHLKHGSLQRYVANICSSEDMGPSKFPSRDVHYIAMLDIRLCNSDRHVGNILVTENLDAEGVRLVPIDHGYVLPKWRYLHELDFCWLYWPQSKQPFTEEELKYIEDLDADAEVKFIHAALGLADDCLRTLRIGTMLLKLGASAGLTLYDIGMLMVRNHPDIRSPLEDEVFHCEDETVKELRRASHTVKLLSSKPVGESVFIKHLSARLQTLVLKTVNGRSNGNNSNNGNNNSNNGINGFPSVQQSFSSSSSSSQLHHHHSHGYSHSHSHSHHHDTGDDSGSCSSGGGGGGGGLADIIESLEL